MLYTNAYYIPPATIHECTLYNNACYICLTTVNNLWEFILPYTPIHTLYHQLRYMSAHYTTMHAIYA